MADGFVVGTIRRCLPLAQWPEPDRAAEDELPLRRREGAIAEVGGPLRSAGWLAFQRGRGLSPRG